MTTCRPLCLVALLLLLAGCAAEQALRSGDAAAAAGRHAQAAEFYQLALSNRPELARDPAFVARLDFARSRAAYDLGSTLAIADEWDRAIAKFTEALTIDPGFAAAADARASARQSGSSWHVGQAVAEADRGNLTAAFDHARQALAYDPANQAARQELDSAGAAPTLFPPDALAHYADALQLGGEKHFPEAIAALRATVAAAPYHLPARAELFRAAQTLAAAQAHAATGSAHLQAKRLDQAIASFDAALQLFPHDPGTQQLLAQAHRQRDEVARLLNAGAASLAAGKFDPALAAATTAAGLYPTHAPALNLIDQVRNAAAASFAAAADRFTADRRFDEAEGAALHALQYVSDFAAARAALAATALGRSRAAEEKGLFGAALLLAQEASARDPRANTAETRQRLRAALIDHRLRYALAYQVQDGAGRVSAETLGLEKHITAATQQNLPAFVALVPPGDPTPPGGPAAFVGALTLAAFEIQERITAAEDKLQPFTEVRPVPNPEIPRLQSQLQTSQRDLLTMRAEYARPCAACQGQGQVTCARCGGTGVLRCPRCDGTGKLPAPLAPPHPAPHSAVNAPPAPPPPPPPCPACKGTGKIDCPACDRGHAKCSACNGSGRASRFTADDLHRQEREVARLEQDLAHAPPLVNVGVPATWPYRVTTYLKTARLVVRLDVKDATTGAVLDSVVLEKTSRNEDQAVANPNPAVGIQPKELALPDDQTIRQTLFAAAAADATARTLGATAGSRAALFLTLANQHEAKREADDALEATVAAALFYETANPGEAKRLFDTLRQRFAPKAPVLAP